MRRTVRLSLLCCLFFAGLSRSAFGAYQAVDDRGVVVRLRYPAVRVISLAPDLTETVFAIGAGNALVGVVRGSDFPVAASKLPRVGSYLGLDMEAIVALHPDLIVAWGDGFSRQLAILKKWGIPVYVSRPRDLQALPRLMRHLGVLLGVPLQATQAASAYSRELTQLQRRYAATRPVTVFFQLGNYSLLTVNQDSWINQMLVMCGGRNIFAEARLPVPEVSMESVAALDPEVIINSSTTTAWKQRWQPLATLRAVKQHRLYTIDPDVIERMGPRALQGVKQLCGWLAG